MNSILEVDEHLPILLPQILRFSYEPYRRGGKDKIKEISKNKKY